MFCDCRVSIGLLSIVAVLCFVTVSEGRATGESKPPAGIEVLDVPLVAWVGSRDHAPPDSLDNFIEPPDRLAQFQKLAEALSAFDWSSAATLAKQLNYQLAAIYDDEQWFVVASDDSKSGRGPVVIVNTTPRTDVIFEAPHVPFEPGTGEEALVLMRALKGRAVLVGGAHRCASRTFATCSGQTAVCGQREDYRNSDVGHNPETLFNVAHVAFSNAWPKSVVVSLHGMMEDNVGVKTRIIISNGIRGEDRGQATPATRLRLALDGRFGDPGSLADCNYPADEAFDYRKLCGFTNVQGREVNGSADTCQQSVNSGTGRFIHLEQDWSVLRPYAHRWVHVFDDPEAAALRDAFAGVLPPSSP